MTTGHTWHITDWQTAELLAVSWLRHWGYVDARVTTGGADGGLDVVASGAVAQVKFEASHVGRPALQRLVGASAHAIGDRYFFSGAGFSKAAIEYADQMGIILCVYDLLGRVSVVGMWAPRVLSEAQRAQVRAQAFMKSGRRRRFWSVVLVSVGVLATFAGVSNTLAAATGSAMDSSSTVGVFLFAGVLLAVGLSAWPWSRRGR